MKNLLLVGGGVANAAAVALAISPKLLLSLPEDDVVVAVAEAVVVAVAAPAVAVVGSVVAVPLFVELNDLGSLPTLAYRKSGDIDSWRFCIYFDKAAFVRNCDLSCGCGDPRGLTIVDVDPPMPVS